MEKIRDFTYFLRNKNDFIYLLTASLMRHTYVESKISFIKSFIEHFYDK